MLTFYELAPSPNGLKTRLMLRYKGVPFETVAVDPNDRSPVVEVSGQELTPVILDKEIVLNDSEAISHYLDANYRDRPRLWPSDKGGRRACDRFKSELDQRITPPWADVFFHAIKLHETMDAQSPIRFREQVSWLEAELGKAPDERAWLPAAINELRIAEWTLYALPGEGLLERVPLFKHFAQLYAIEAGAFPRLEEFLAPWQERAS